MANTNVKTPHFCRSVNQPFKEPKFPIVEIEHFNFNCLNSSKIVHNYKLLHKIKARFGGIITLSIGVVSQITLNK